MCKRVHHEDAAECRRYRGRIDPKPQPPIYERDCPDNSLLLHKCAKTS